jgi:hypothetical protein
VKKTRRKERKKEKKRRKKLYWSIRSIDEKANTHKCRVCKKKRRKKVIIQEYISGGKE